MYKSIKLSILSIFCQLFVNYLSIFVKFFFSISPIFYQFFCQRTGELNCLESVYDLTKTNYSFFLPNYFRPFDGPGGGGGQSSPVPQTSGNKSVTRYEEISNKQSRPGLNSYNNEWVVWCD